MLYILLHLLTCAYQKHLMDVLVPCLRRHMDQEPKPIELWLDFGLAWCLERKVQLFKKLPCLLMPPKDSG